MVIWGEKAEILIPGGILQSQMERAHHMSVLVENLAEVVTPYLPLRPLHNRPKSKILGNDFKVHMVQEKSLQPWQAGVHQIIS